MIKYCCYNDSFLVPIWECYTSAIKEEVIYLNVSLEEFKNNLINHIDFDSKGLFIALDNNIVAGFIHAYTRKKDPYSENGYITTIAVRKNYRNMGIGSRLIELAKNYLKEQNKKKAFFSYLSTLNWPWYANIEKKYLHPGAPGVMVNSELYLFLINNHFEVIDHQDAFCTEIINYNEPPFVTAAKEKASKEGLTIEIYDSTRHAGLDRFFKSIDTEAFERVIRENLALKNPKPFAVIVKNKEIYGWTGAFYREESGRAHFDGIIIDESIRGKGMGRALFSYIPSYSKQIGATYMSFFTGRTNYARYIYMSLGFKIVKSFAIMSINL